MQDHHARVPTPRSGNPVPPEDGEPRSTVPWDRFRSAFELAPIGMALSSPDGTYQVVNHAFCRLLGRSEEELEGTSYLDVTHPDDREGNRTAVENVLDSDADRVQVEKRYLRPDGSRVWAHVTASLLRDSKRRPLGWIIQAEDVTEHRAAMHAVRLNANRLEEAQRIAHLGHWEWHLDTGACAWSEELCRILGGPPESVRPGIDPFLERVHPEDRARVRHHLDRAVRSAGSYVVDHRVVWPDGTVRWVRGEGHMESGRDGRPLRMIGIVQDITDREEAEQQLRANALQLQESQRFESVRRLAGGIAHDFNNLLLVITGHAALLQSRLDEDDAARTEVEAIRGAAERAAGLTRQLLAFSRRQVVDVRVLDMNVIVSDVEKALHRMIGEDVELVTVLQDEAVPVRADHGHLEQVLLNLAVNARDAMPDGGTLTISTHREEVGEEDAEEPKELSPGSYVVLSVMDTGTGMDAETVSRIFEPFFTTKAKGKGTGLGLSTVHGIVTQYGGDIRVASRPGSGTCFRVYLPSTDAPAESDAPQVVAEAATGGSETILVVEDDEMIHDLTMRILSDSGYRVLGARSGVEALRVLEGYRAPIHLCVTDVVMPGLSGPELVRRARAMRPDMEILYVTGYADHPEVVGPGAEDGTSLLRKPFTPLDLQKTVRELLDAAEASGASLDP